jgi:hypothetical protein
VRPRAAFRSLVKHASLLANDDAAFASQTKKKPVDKVHLFAQVVKAFASFGCDGKAFALRVRAKLDATALSQLAVAVSTVLLRS